ncbi:hypothetical protein QAD02_020991 [Eretmocerus hayati]|uniref:Uncharacterized protein n=1 Tax=Eretmocerus hayati TaxID=131215 RepID=A0ACC2PQA8_9HYME|nr:hypothetical protein QAD02_020991 [Eretmocerus hayati]
MYVLFKERDEKQRLNYASDEFISMVNITHTHLYRFLDKRAFETKLEAKFQQIFGPIQEKDFHFCDVHDRISDSLETGTSFLIFKYCKDVNKVEWKSAGHAKKMARFTQNRVKKNKKK